MVQQQPRSLHQPLSEAVYVSLDSLLGCRLLAKDLNLAQQRKLLSSQSGLHTTRFRGRGIDFAEVRAYQSGDDIRTIDWRVTARTGKAHTKLYAEERERPVVLLTDQRQSMFFGSKVRFKSVAAAQAAALLGWAALARGDKVGGLVFAEDGHAELRPKRSPQRMLQLLERLLDFNHRLHKDRTSPGDLDLAQALAHLRRTTRPGSELFLISDFHDFNAECQQQLFQLSRHNDLICVCVSDPLEAQLPPPGLYALSDGAQRRTLILHNNIRQQYQEHYRDHMEQLKAAMDRLQIPFIRLRTDADPLPSLQLGLGIKARRR